MSHGHRASKRYLVTNCPGFTGEQGFLSKPRQEFSSVLPQGSVDGRPAKSAMSCLCAAGEHGSYICKELRGKQHVE